MSNRWLKMVPGVVWLGMTCSALHAEAPAKAVAPVNDPAVLAARIDQLIEATYAARKATPTTPADDAEFLRRVNLDLAGRIPRVSEVRDFLDDTSPDKRRRAVEQILNSPHYVNHMTNVWRSMMLPQNNNQQVQFLAPAMESWLRKRFRDNMAYDQMVRELLTANITNNPNNPFQPAQPNPQNMDANAQAFYQANELKPENLAAATSRLFLGVKLECAQCHDHPFAKWSREQFWEYAAFFSGVGRQMPQQPQDDDGLSPAVDAAHRHEIKMPGKGKVLQARFLDGKQPKWSEDTPTRVVLAEWVTSSDNPYFARAAVNRVWAHLFGVGIIEPADDLREDNPASHPELLDELARAFVANKYDLKYLIRAITLSKAYQLSSSVAAPNPENDDQRLFTRVAVKGMTAEQLYDSLALATGYADSGEVDPRFINPGAPGNARAEFLTKFSNSADKRTETQTSILQALSLMNGRITADATSLERSRTLAGVLDSPFMDDRQRLETLYLAALGRPMRAEEAERMMKYVQKGGPSGDSRKALADVFWVLLNSSEFILNH